MPFSPLALLAWLVLCLHPIAPTSKVSKHGEIDYESCAKLAEGFNGADLRNVCTEAGMFAIRAGRGYTINDDFSKATRKLLERLNG